jgi:hypothetical protein
LLSRRVLLAVLGVVVLLIVLVGALVFGGFFNSPSPTRGPAELADLTPDGLADAPGLGYDLTIEVGEATAGGTTTKIVLELERLDPPPVITPPAP